MGLPNEIHPFLVTGNAANQYKIPYSLRFRASNSAYLSRTPTVASNQTTFTWSGWVKLGTLSTYYLFAGGTSSSNRFQIDFYLNSLEVSMNNGSWIINLLTTQVFRDPAAWYHVVVAVDTTQATSTNRVKVYINGSQVTSFQTSTYPTQNLSTPVNSTVEHDIGQSQGGGGGYFDGYMAEINFVDGYQYDASYFGLADNITNQWVSKKYTGTYGTNGFYLPFSNPTTYYPSDTATVTAPFGGTATNARVTDGAYVTSNTSTGSSFTFVQYDFGSAIWLSRYYITNLYFTGGTSTFQVQYGNDATWNSYTVAGSLSVTGSAQTFSGSIMGSGRYVRLIPTAFGVNGQANVDAFVLYQDNLGNDYSGNGNNWLPNNISLNSGVTYDSMKDVPTSWDDGGTGRGNYCTINPLATNSTYSLTNGNLTWSFSSSTLSNYWSRSAFAVDSGKWYWEINVSNEGAGQNLILGIQNATTSAFVSGSGQDIGSGYGYISDGTKITSTSVTAYANAYTANDVVGIALDMDNGAIYFSKNNTWQNSGDPTSGSSKTGAAYTSISGNYNPLIATAIGGGITRTTAGSVNFGQRPFSYTPPIGFKALNSYNLAQPSLPLV